MPELLPEPPVLDIAAALDAVPAGVRSGKCKVQRWLDTIPVDAPSRNELVATLSTSDKESPHYRTEVALRALCAKLGLTVTDRTIGMHRRKDCGCYV